MVAARGDGVTVSQFKSPQRWPRIPLRHLFNIVSGATPTSSDESLWEGDIPWVTPEDVGALQGIRIKDTRRKLTLEGFNKCGTRLAQKNSIVLTKRAPIGQLAILDIEACSNQGCFLLSPREGVDSRFYYYLLLSKVKVLQVSGRGTTFLELSTDVLKSLPVVFPLHSEQLIVADFLDRETARIDSLISAKENYLTLIAEKRHALITSAVTRGIDPTVRFRKSGIPWLGPVPEHWEITRAKNLFREVDQRSLTGEETLLSLRMQLGLVPHNSVSEKVIPSEALIGYKIAELNQIVVNRMRAASGLIAVVPQPGIVSPDYAVFQPKNGIDPEYYTHLFTTPLLQAVFRSESKGLGTGSSGFLRLYSDNFLSINLPKPPSEEQPAIADYIRSETAKLDELKTATERTIILLRERRSTLIAEVVSGQLDLGGKRAN